MDVVGRVLAGGTGRTFLAGLGGVIFLVGTRCVVCTCVAGRTFDRGNRVFLTAGGRTAFFFCAISPVLTFLAGDTFFERTGCTFFIGAGKVVFSF
jgi:hypothetical protein